MHAPLTFHCVLLIINLQWLFSSAVHDHLMSDDTLSFVASHIGIGDLMLCAVSSVLVICCVFVFVFFIMNINIKQIHKLVAPRPSCLWSYGKTFNVGNVSNIAYVRK